MGLWRRDGSDSGDPVASSRWIAEAGSVDERYQSLAALPLEEAVEAALLAAPGGLTREELTRRMAATRGIDPPEL